MTSVRNWKTITTEPPDYGSPNLVFSVRLFGPYTTIPVFTGSSPVVTSSFTLPDRCSSNVSPRETK